MTGKTARFVAVLALAALCFVSPQQQARAGGFGFIVEPPTVLSADSRPEDIVFNVRAFSCLGPATVAGKAEGLVDGKRVSIPLKLNSLGEDRYTVSRQWPEQGTWVISLFMKSVRAIGQGPKRFHMTNRLLVHPGTEASREGLAKTDSSERRGVGRDIEWHTVGTTGLYYRRPWGNEEASLVEAVLRVVEEASVVPP